MLPPDVLNRILLFCDIRTVLAARRVSTLLFHHATAIICILEAAEGVLPPSAWQTFLSACQLVVTAKPTTDAAHYYDALCRLVDSLPDRIAAITISRAGISHDKAVCALSSRLAQALAKSRCKDHITRLHIHQRFTPSAADVILNRLANIQDLHLSITRSKGSYGSLPWRPVSPSPRLLSLSLTFTTDMHVDLAPLAFATSLATLAITGWPTVTSTSALAQLAALRTLHLDVDLHPSETNLALIDHVSSLAQLSDLRLGTPYCSPAAWRRLAALPALRQVHLTSLGLSQELPAAPQVVVLTTSARMFFEGAAAAAAAAPGQEQQQELAGCLARLLPGLQVLHTVAMDPQQLLAALQGHAQLRELVLGTGLFSGLLDKGQYEQGLRQALPGLKELQVV